MKLGVVIVKVFRHLQLEGVDHHARVSFPVHHHP
jgi:hypothetical protein